MKDDLNGVVSGDQIKEIGEKLPDLPKGRKATPLETYVAEARLASEAEAEKRWPPILDDKKAANERQAEIDARVDKAEGYARWRWEGYVNGEISGL